jgi:hypothetical protein
MCTLPTKLVMCYFIDTIKYYPIIHIGIHLHPSL